jgi:hypothetical protein
MQNRLKARALIGVALAFAMMAASCGDDDDAPVAEEPAASEPAAPEPADPEPAVEPADPEEADSSEEPDDSAATDAETADEAAASDETDDSDAAATEEDEPVAAPAPSLADVCPSPIIVQHDWYPDYTHGPMFQLAGPGGEIDDNGYYTNEIEPGVTIQLRAGGPAVGFQPPSSLIYQDPSILIGHGLDRQHVEFVRRCAGRRGGEPDCGQPGRLDVARRRVRLRDGRRNCRQ